MIGEDIWYFLAIYYEVLYWPYLMAGYIRWFPVFLCNGHSLTLYLNLYLFCLAGLFSFKAAFCHFAILLSREFCSKSSPDLIYSITNDHLLSSNVLAQ